MRIGPTDKAVALHTQSHRAAACTSVMCASASFRRFSRDLVLPLPVLQARAREVWHLFTPHSPVHARNTHHACTHCAMLGCICENAVQTADSSMMHILSCRACSDSSWMPICWISHCFCARFRACPCTPSMRCDVSCQHPISMDACHGSMRHERTADTNWAVVQLDCSIVLPPSMRPYVIFASHHTHQQVCKHQHTAHPMHVQSTNTVSQCVRRCELRAHVVACNVQPQPHNIWADTHAAHRITSAEHIRAAHILSHTRNTHTTHTLTHTRTHSHTHARTHTRVRHQHRHTTYPMHATRITHIHATHHTT